MRSNKSLFLIKYAIFYLVVLLSIIYLLALFWLPLTGRGYEIPKESSVFTFNATLMNQGSGEWWIYGADNQSYYYMTQNGSPPYIVYSKKKADKCDGFIETLVTTWCDLELNPLWLHE